VIVTNDAAGVQVEGSFARIEAAQSRSATVLQSVGGGAHRVRFVADPGVRGYYRVLLWWPQAGGAAEVVVHGLQGAQRVPVAPGLRSGQWLPVGVFALPASGVAIDVAAAAGAPLVVDALRLQYVGATPPPPAFDVDALPVAIAGTPYTATLALVDGTPPLVFNVDPANLPPGLDFDAVTGTLAGVPQTPGYYRFDVEVFDHNGARVQQAFELHVVAASKGSSAADPPLKDALKLAAPLAKDGVAAATPPNLSGLVTLLAALPEGEWTQASLNTYASVWTPAELRPLDGQSNPAPDRIILAWSGFTWDPNRGDLLLYGGGHANYSGNDVYRWRGSTRQWERASLPSQIKQDDLGNFQAIDGWDNAPGSAHTYDTNSFFPHLDRMVVFGGAAYNSGSAFMREVTPTTARTTGPFFFDPARADPNKVGGTTGSHVQRVAPHPEIVGGQMWANRDVYVNIPNNPSLPGNFVNGCAAYAEENGKDVAYLGARPPGGSTALFLYKYTANALASPAQDTVSLAGVFWNGTDNATSCGVDPLRKLFVRTGNAAVPFVYWDLSTPGSGNRDVRVTPTDPSGEFPTLLASGNVTLPNCGFDFDARRNRFALWCGDGRVWMLTPPATASPLGWTIQKQRAPTRAIPNGDVGTGILGKWKYIPNLDAFIGLQDYTLGNIWIYKPVGWVNPQQPLALAAPTSVNASDGTSTANVAVTWKAVSGATSYSVYRSTTAGSQGTLLGSTASLSFLDSSATAGVTYFYGVTASGGGSTSALSAQDSGFRAGALSSNLNVALAANGGVATASSTNGPGFPPGATIDNQRSGAGWGAGGGWNDASFGQFPDWLQVTFSSLRSIDRVVVYSVQDNYLSPVEPSDTMTFTKYGVTTFTVKGRSGSSWTVLGTITGNNLVKRTVTFPAFTTDAIRIEVGNGLAGYSRLVEVEAWAGSAPSLPATLPATTSDISSTSNPALAGTQVTLTATVRGTRPTGSVKFSDGAVAIGGCTAVALTGGGNAPVAACNTSTLAIGTHAIVASYGGDAANAPSSAGLSQVIGGPGTSTNVALASVGAVATASSQFSAAYPVSAVNNGDRKGTGWGAGGGWNDASANVYPDTVQVVFNGSKTINRVAVYTLQDNYTNPLEPTDTTTFTRYGATAFTVEGRNGSTWKSLGTVTGNNQVKRSVTFPAFAADAVRINVTNALGGYSRLVEVEAWGTAAP
jgi:hypothetical protein